MIHMKKRIAALWLAALPSGDTTTAANVSNVKITPSEAKQAKLVDYKTADFSMKIPEGWSVTAGGIGMFHAIRVTDPKNPINQVAIPPAYGCPLPSHAGFFLPFPAAPPRLHHRWYGVFRF